MGLLEDALNKVDCASTPQNTSGTSLASVVLSTLLKQSGGITGLAHQFTAKGFGDIIHSWISTGQNLPISTEQVQTALGAKQVETIASMAGISPEAAQSGLTQVLPLLVDQLTPDGKIPQGDIMSKGMELIEGKLFL